MNGITYCFSGLDELAQYFDILSQRAEKRAENASKVGDAVKARTEARAFAESARIIRASELKPD